MHNFAAAQQSNNKRFTGVLEKEQELYAHEEALADGQTGTLTPSDIPTPVNACTSKGKIPKGATLVLIEDNAYWFTRFPHVILESMSKGPIVSIEKTQTNQLAVIFDLRSADGKVIAQMNADGYVINRNNTLQIKKSKSELSVIDLFGSNVLNVKYLNPQVVSVTGIPTPSSLHDSCSGEAGRTDILIR